MPGTLLLLATLIASHAQPNADTIVVGHASVQPARIRIGTDTTEVFGTRNGVRQKLSTDIQSTTRTTDGYLVVQVNEGRGGASIDSTFLAASTFAPTRHVEVAPGHFATFTYADGTLTGTIRDSTGSHTVTESVPSTRFDYSTIQQVTAALPLAAGYSAVIVAYDVAPPRQNRSIGFRVIGRENISWNGHDVDAWRTVTDFGTHEVTRWTDATTHRDIRWSLTFQGATMEGITK